MVPNCKAADLGQEKHFQKFGSTTEWYCGGCWFTFDGNASTIGKDGLMEAPDAKRWFCYDVLTKATVAGQLAVLKGVFIVLKGAAVTR